MSKEYKVLIADDSAFARKVTFQFLDGTEFKVVEQASTTKEAVEKYAGTKPDIALLDVIMPEQGGLEALKAIKAQDPRAMVVMLSSLGTEETVMECLSLGAKGFVQKPFDKDALLGYLRKTVAE